jgi:hypothetical protein
MLPAHKLAAVLAQARYGKLAGDKPATPQQLGPFNDPNSILGQLGDSGHAMLRAASIQPFGPEDPSGYHTTDTGSTPGSLLAAMGAPRYSTDMNQSAQMPGLPGSPASALEKAGAKVSMEIPDLLRNANSRSLFLAPGGPVFDLGEGAHLPFLQKAGLASATSELSDMTPLMRANGLARVHTYKGADGKMELALHFAQRPTPEQFAHVDTLLGQLRKGENISFDLQSPGRDRVAGLTTDPGEVLQGLERMPAFRP